MSIEEARDKLYEDFRSRMSNQVNVIRINSAYPDNFNLSLLGISDLIPILMVMVYGWLGILLCNLS